MLDMSDEELDHLLSAGAARGPSHGRKAQRRSSQGYGHAESSPRISPRYGYVSGRCQEASVSSGVTRVRVSKIESQFLPAKIDYAAPLVGGTLRAHKIVIRTGRLVDVTEEEEDHLAITALRKAEEHAREALAAHHASHPSSSSASGSSSSSPTATPPSSTSPMQSPHLSTSPSPDGPPKLTLERVRLSRNSNSAGGRSPRVITAPAASSSPRSHHVVTAPVVVSLREIRAAVAELYSEVKTVNLAPVSAAQHVVEMVHEPVAVSMASVAVVQTAKPMQVRRRSRKHVAFLSHAQFPQSSLKPSRPSRPFRCVWSRS